MMHPIERFGIVGSQFDGDDVRLKCQRVLKHLLFHVRTVSLVQECASAVTVIAYFVVLAQHLTQQTRVAVSLLIGNSGALGYTVAHTGHFDGFLGLQGHDCSQKEAKNQNFSFH